MRQIRGQIEDNLHLLKRDQLQSLPAVIIVCGGTLIIVLPKLVVPELLF